jgi:Rhodopirellula transposase DDE domain
MPPRTSKRNKIEHRLFSFISINWRGKPLRSYRAVVQLIAGTTTDTGLTVRAELDENKYPKGVEVSDAEFSAIKLSPHSFPRQLELYDLPESEQKSDRQLTTSFIYNS